MTKFTVEDKLAAVQRYLGGRESYASIGASIGTSKALIMNWVRQYQYHGESKLPSRKAK
ncbi:transposase [Ectobacillus polymachus]|uniref:transposase n=1 Tax=Ectobacillus polymachus TaxID=1508806 RepID=UPI003A8C091D